MRKDFSECRLIHTEINLLLDLYSLYEIFKTENECKYIVIEKKKRADTGDG